jgi:hypothetical protein
MVSNEVASCFWERAISRFVGAPAISRSFEKGGEGWRVFSFESKSEGLLHRSAMSITNELAALFRRDLTRLRQELEAFPDDGMLWTTLPGAGNSAGNLALHLDGNLREFIGRQLGEVPYERRRDAEFSSRDVSKADLVKKVEGLIELVPRIVASLPPAVLESKYPQNVFANLASTQQLVISLHGHLNFHLGQIDYLRRILTKGKAIEFAGL